MMLMRLCTLSIVLAATLIAVAAAGRASAAVMTPAGPSAVLAQQQNPPPVSSDDGSRVGVQVGVLCAAVALVVVGGTGAYFLRRVLGLTASPPKQDAGGHH
jgi:hypothetical protein